MTGFFRDIQGYFSADFSGRYISRIIRELARHEPASFACIIDIALKQLKSDRFKYLAQGLHEGALGIECEMSFSGASGRRRQADLVLLREGRVATLFEVKEHDVKSQRNGLQLSDYLALVSREDVLFIHLSRFSPESADRRQMERAKVNGLPVASIRYRDIYKVLDEAGGPIARMVCQYLEDIGVTSYRTINFDEQDRAVAFALVKMLGFRHAHGKGKLVSDQAVSDLPGILQTIFGNLEFLGDMIKETNPDLIRTRFARDFRPVPMYNLARLERALAKHPIVDGESEILPRGSGAYVDWGYVEFTATGRISTSKPSASLAVSVYYSLRIETGKSKNLVDIYVGAAFYGAQLDTFSEMKCNKFPTEIQALRLMHDCLNKAKQKAIQKTPVGPLQQALKRFRIPVRP